MSRAIALLVGLKRVDSQAYDGWDGVGGCWGCELDVDNVEMILRPLGYETDILKTEQATADNVLGHLNQAVAQLESGDIFIFYFSGHGGQQPDLDSDELDGRDETLIAYDRPIIDDELDLVWQKIKQGVRLVMLSDSCNSGTNYRSARVFSDPTPFIPLASADRDTPRSIQAQMIHMGGCRDGFASAGYYSGGAFTIALCNAWRGGLFQGSYPLFYQRICELVTSDQKPQYNKYGPVSPRFENQRPFSVRNPDSVLEPGKRVAFRVKNGQYFCAEGGGGRELVANREWIRSWETFELIELGNSRIALRANNGQFVCAEGGGGRELVANRNWIRSWETFELIELGNNNVALRAHNGRYVCAEGGGGREVVANRNWIRSWETFKLVEVE